jgi:hypothetical protein
MFNQRKFLHQIVYKHKVVSAIEFMFVDMIDGLKNESGLDRWTDNQLIERLREDARYVDLINRRIYKHLGSIKLIGASSMQRQQKIKGLIKVGGFQFIIFERIMFYLENYFS